MPIEALATLPYLVVSSADALADVADDGAQILQIEHRDALVGGEPEGDVEDALLHLVEVHQPRDQQRAHVLDGGADRVALLAEDVPEHHRIVVEGEVGHADLLDAGVDEVLRHAGLRDAGKVALDVGGKHRHAGGGKALGQHLQRHRLAGAGGAGDEAMAVAELQLKAFGLRRVAEKTGADVDLAGFCHCCVRSVGF